MESEDFPKELAGDAFGVICCVAGDEVNHLGEAISDCQYGVFVLEEWVSNYPINGDGVPFLKGDNQWLEITIQRLAKCLCSLAGVAMFYVGLEQLAEFG